MKWSADVNEHHAVAGADVGPVSAHDSVAHDCRARLSLGVHGAALDQLADEASPNRFARPLTTTAWQWKELDHFHE